MKRISLLSILLLSFLCTYTQARDYWYVPLKYRVHWSPYSQSLVSGFVEYSPYSVKYKNNGLVSDSLNYSPYALNYGTSGLIHYFADYTPYALGYGKSGLVTGISGRGYGSGYSGYSSTINQIHRNISCNQNTDLYMTKDYYEYTKKLNEQRANDRKYYVEKRKAQLEKIKESKAQDPSESIRQFRS